MEDCTGNQSNDRQLRSARDEAGCHDGHTAVTFILDRSCCHDSGNTAAGADQHRDEGLAGQTEPAEQTVHDKRYTGHISNVFQNAQHQEQYKHLRYKAEYSADTVNNTICHEADKPVCRTKAFHQ